MAWSEYTLDFYVVSGIGDSVKGRIWHLVVLVSPRRYRWYLEALRRRGLRRGLREFQWLRRGTYPEIDALQSGDPNDYLNERDRESRTGKINGERSVFLNDKVVFHLTLPGHLLPPLVGLVVDGRSVTPNGEPLDLVQMLCAAAEQRLVIRPAKGRKGHGLLFVQSAAGAVSVNGELVSEAHLSSLIAAMRYHLVTKYVDQHPYSETIFAGSVNSLRLLMLRDPESGEPFLAKAYHRFGTSRSAPVDNWSRGGLSVSVDLDTGRLGRGMMHQRFSSRVMHPTHPETGAQIEGIQVPHWEHLVQQMHWAMRSLPMISYVGWDAVQTIDGPKIIEGNHLPDLPQEHGGLLRDPRVRRFYEHHGVISSGIANS